jgi:hypothetical protein
MPGAACRSDHGRLENPSLALRNGLRVKVAAMTATTHNPSEEHSWNFPGRAMAWNQSFDVTLISINLGCRSAF